MCMIFHKVIHISREGTLTSAETFLVLVFVRIFQLNEQNANVNRRGLCCDDDECAIGRFH